MHYLAMIYKSSVFAEDEIVENIQFGLLVVSTCVFLTEAYFFPKYKPLLLLLATCALMAAFRELDKFLDSELPVISWRLGFIFIFGALYYAYRHREIFEKNLLRFLSSTSFYMLCGAVIVIIPIAQCIGHRPFVINVLGEDKVANIKEFFEESCEAVGYFWILLSSLECYFDLLQKRKK